MREKRASRVGEKHHCSICGAEDHSALRHHKPTHKTCTVCKETLPVDCFYPKKMRGFIGLTSHCKKCDNASTSTRFRGSFRGRLVGLVNAAKMRARKEGWEYDINIEFLMGLLESQERRCYYTGSLLTFETGNNGVSIDRKDSVIGYVKSNVVLTSWVINNMKGNLSHEAFLFLCKQITSHHPT